MKALSILLSALFTVATAESLGLLLLQRLRVRLTRGEQILYGFVCGSAVLSLTVFALAAAHVLWTPVLAIVGALSIAACTWRRAYRFWGGKLDGVPRLYLLLLCGTLLAYSAFYFPNALAPEASSDGSAYHLGYVQRFLDWHGFGRITTSMYANMPFGIEMLFLFAFAFGRHSAAALVHFSFLVALTLFLVMVARRAGFPRAGVVAGILIFASPVFGIDGSSAYVDVATACIVFALFGILEIWDDTRDAKLLALAGLLAGFACSAKLTAFVAVPYAIVFVVWKSLRKRQPVLKPALLVAGCAAIMIMPWLAKNAITVGNPVSPFLNRYFPNPNVRISFEEGYRREQRGPDELKSPWQIPLEVTVRGSLLQGLLGPAFLLAPMGLLALRWGIGRHALLAAAFFLSTYPANTGTRFLIGAAPFLAFAIGLVVSHWRAMAPLLMLFTVVVCWPSVVPLYANESAWRLDRMFWRAALRLQPESEYLNYHLEDYAPSKLAEGLVPPNGRIFTLGGIAEAYCRREVIIAYQSAYGNTLAEALTAAVVPTYLSDRWWTYEFPRQKTRRLRLVQTGNHDREMWAVGELRLFSPEGELQRNEKWRLRASVNPWEVQRAFDNCPISRWVSAEPARIGQYVEVEFDQPVELVGVRVEASRDQVEGSARVEVEESGGWRVVARKPFVADGAPVLRARRLAVDDLKRAGITHISMKKDEFLAPDIARNTAAWGLTKVGAAGTATLYRID